jgi:hypothetical protein
MVAQNHRTSQGHRPAPGESGRVWNHRGVRAFGVASVVVAAGLLASSCTDDTEDAFMAHPRLQCLEGEKQLTPPAEYDTSQPGAPTAEDALRPMLEAAAGPDRVVVRVSNEEFGLSADGRIVLIAKARQTRPGEWHFVDEFFCE